MSICSSHYAGPYTPKPADTPVDNSDSDSSIHLAIPCPSHHGSPLVVDDETEKYHASQSDVDEHTLVSESNSQRTYRLPQKVTATTPRSIPPPRIPPPKIAATSMLSHGSSWQPKSTNSTRESFFGNVGISPQRSANGSPFRAAVDLSPYREQCISQKSPTDLSLARQLNAEPLRQAQRSAQRSPCGSVKEFRRSAPTSPRVILYILDFFSVSLLVESRFVFYRI